MAKFYLQTSTKTGNQTPVTQAQKDAAQGHAATSRNFRYREISEEEYTRWQAAQPQKPESKATAKKENAQPEKKKAIVPPVEAAQS